MKADAVPSGDVIWHAEKIWRGITLLHSEVDDSTIQDEELVKVIHFQKVYCASGESDTESIRDMESGPGEFRWNRRHPYWYRRDPCLDDSRSYRRRMKPNLQYENDVGEASLV